MSVRREASRQGLIPAMASGGLGISNAARARALATLRPCVISCDASSRPAVRARALTARSPSQNRKATSSQGGRAR